MPEVIWATRDDPVSFDRRYGIGPGNRSCADSAFAPNCPGSYGYEIASLEAKGDLAGADRVSREEKWNSFGKLIRPACSSKEEHITFLLNSSADREANKIRIQHAIQKDGIVQALRISQENSTTAAEAAVRAASWRGWWGKYAIVVGKVAVSTTGLKGITTWSRDIGVKWVQGGRGWSRIYNTSTYALQGERAILPQMWEELKAVSAPTVATKLKLWTDRADGALSLTRSGLDGEVTGILFSIGGAVPVFGGVVTAAEGALDILNQVNEAIALAESVIKEEEATAESQLALLRHITRERDVTLRQLESARLQRLTEIKAHYEHCLRSE
jgi:hypothetical protein